MGAMGAAFGLDGGSLNNYYALPRPAQINPGTNAAQLATSYGGAQNSLASQQALLAALQAQGGLANQSQIYNQLQGVANGTGPNPAQAMLNQNTGANVANQAALMAGQRGASANPALMARQAAQQGAAIQQNAVGQGATMQANQSLGALNAAGALANTQASNLMAGTGANTTANQNEQQILQGANSQANTADVAMQSNINNARSQMGISDEEGLRGGGGGMLQGAGMAAMLLSSGGAVPQSHLGKFFAAKGGSVPALVSPQEKYLSPSEASSVATGHKRVSQVGKTVPGKAKVKGDSTKNDTVPAKLQPGGVVVKRSIMNSKGSDDKAAKFVQAVLAKKGARK